MHIYLSWCSQFNISHLTKVKLPLRHTQACVCVCVNPDEAIVAERCWSLLWMWWAAVSQAVWVCVTVLA